MRKELLVRRLDDIGLSLEKSKGALLLLGLGSVGVELERLDEYSDLDFFVIVKKGYKERFLKKLDWLQSAYLLAYAFQNTNVGYKVLFEDGVYGEFAVFEENELENISYSGGRIVWKCSSLGNVDIPVNKNLPTYLQKNSLDFSINEALTNLYVGLCRYARGEKLSALRFIEGYALNNILTVLHLLEKEENHLPDQFSIERRVEKRFPSLAEKLSGMLQGYEHTPKSALRILDYLESVYQVNPRMSSEIRSMMIECEQVGCNVNQSIRTSEQ
ncbi:hypothetical protein LCL95_14480 [Bacillus timonensis]|nr:hypothetical protein [Bacillus timonensis]